MERKPVGFIDCIRPDNGSGLGQTPYSRVRTCAEVLLSVGWPVEMEIVLHFPGQTRQAWNEVAQRAISHIKADNILVESKEQWLAEAVRASGKKMVRISQLPYWRWQPRRGEEGLLRDRLATILHEIHLRTQKGRRPVVVQSQLGYYFNDYPEAEFVQVFRDLGVPILSQDELSFNGTEFSANIPSVLRGKGIDPSQVVLLGNHYWGQYASRGAMLEAGLTELPFVPVCPCCIGLNRGWLVAVADSGGQLLYLEYPGERRLLAEQLASLINSS